MQCEQCGDETATVHLTQVIDGEVKKLHLCQTCASECGFDLQETISMTDMLLGIDGDAPVTTKPTSELERACPVCQLRKSDFKKTGQFGCPNCYETFVDELKPLLKAMHRGERHVGKVPEREGKLVRVTAEIATLEKQLQDAIAAEHFEDAARLRDQLRNCRLVAEAQKEVDEL